MQILDSQKLYKTQVFWAPASFPSALCTGEGGTWACLSSPSTVESVVVAAPG